MGLGETPGEGRTMQSAPILDPQLATRVRDLAARMENDLSFRQAVLADPKAALAQNLGVGFAPGVDNEALRERWPSFLSPGENGERSRQLSDEELDTVAGGPTMVEYALMLAMITLGLADPVAVVGEPVDTGF